MKKPAGPSPGRAGRNAMGSIPVRPLNPVTPFARRGARPVFSGKVHGIILGGPILTRTGDDVND